MATPDYDEGDVVLIRARVRKRYRGEGLASVRISMAAGPRAYQNVVIWDGAVERRRCDPGDDRLVPPFLLP